MLSQVLLFATVVTFANSVTTNLQLRQCEESCQEVCITSATNDVALKRALRDCATILRSEMRKANQAAANCTNSDFRDDDACKRHIAEHDGEESKHVFTGLPTPPPWPFNSYVQSSNVDGSSDHHFHCTRQCKRSCRERCELDASTPPPVDPDEWKRCPVHKLREDAFEHFKTCVMKLNLRPNENENIFALADEPQEIDQSEGHRISTKSLFIVIGVVAAILVAAYILSGLAWYLRARRRRKHTGEVNISNEAIELSTTTPSHHDENPVSGVPVLR